MDHKADVLIVTVIEAESRAVLKTFEPAAGRKATPRSIDDRTYFDLGVVNSARVFMTQSEMGSGGLDASLLTVRKGIEALNPAALPKHWPGKAGRKRACPTPAVRSRFSPDCACRTTWN